MAKHIVKFSCGHEVEMNLTGKMESRESYKEWAAHEGLCYKCKAEAKRKEEAKKSEDINETKKQIVDMAQDMVAKAPPEKKPLFEKQISIFLEVVESKKSEFWRDRIGVDVRYIFNEIGKESAQKTKENI